MVSLPSLKREALHGKGMPDETHSYTGLNINHRENEEAPNLYILASNSRDLTEWAEVPRANPDFMDGYQRQLEPNRLEEIKEFLSEEVNIIPGAILVTVDEDYISVDENGDTAEITISEPGDRDLEELLQEAYEELYSRLSDHGQEYVDNISDEEGNEGEEVDQDPDGQPISYLARKTKELKKKVENFEEVSNEEKDDLEQYVERVNKPGLIIDGQHRVHGARKYQGEIEYPIVLIPGLDSKEQVYHFYIINDKAEPISQEELLITVATALSEKESDQLMTRLMKAGVDVDKARYPYMADVEEESPFHQMVNYEEKVGEQTGAVDFRTMYMLMNRFVEMKGGHKYLYKEIDGWYGDDATRYRINKFYVFWEAIKSEYSDLWEDAKAAVKDEEFEGEGYDNESPDQFFQKNAMRVFQEYILEELADKQENRQSFLDELEDSVRDDLWEYIFEDDDVLKSQVSEVVGEIPAEFFRRKWNTGGLGTNENRNNFKEQLETAANTTPKGMPQLRIFNKGF